MKLTKAARRKIIDNIDIAETEAARAHRTQPRATHEELLSSAYYALCMVALKPYQGEQFRKIARIACRHHIIIDQLKLHRDHIGKYPLVRKTIEETIDTPDILSRLIATEDLIRVFYALPCLDRRPKQVLSRLLKGATVTEIAIELKVGISCVSVHLMRGVARLKRRLCV
jgi:RNA polymerase sigma factor (sigma-70 family)